MGEPSLGSRWTKPSTFSILPATADEGSIVIKSAMAGRFSKWGMWRSVDGTGSLAGESARTVREGPRWTRRTSRRTQDEVICLLTNELDESLKTSPTPDDLRCSK